jgi:sulfur-oxidizing protein SoxX
MVSPAMARRDHVFRTNLCFASILVSFITAASAQSMPTDGRALFIDERKGNCSACHKTPTDATLKSASNIGSPLESIKQKYATPADRMRLRNAVWDSSKTLPNTIMPPYGKHRILTDVEIDAILTYLETL